MRSEFDRPIRERRCGTTGNRRGQRRSLCLILSAAALGLAGLARAEKVTVAAAADLKFALDEIVTLFAARHPGDRVEVVYGSSGKLSTQIRQGAPYDLYFSADIDFPRRLAEDGFAAGAVVPYALGRIVLWSPRLDATRMTLESLLDPAITRVAIANPKHAPYGRRAEEALRASGLWDRVEPKLVYGDNIAHTAQYVETGNAEVGILALSLVLAPALERQGGYWLIPDRLHQPLEQGFVVTRRAAGSELARRFAGFVAAAEARAVLTRYGFALPEDPADRPPPEAVTPSGGAAR